MKKQFPSLIKGKNWLFHKETNEWVVVESAVKEHLMDKKKVEEDIDNFEFGAWNQMDPYDVWVKRELKIKLGFKK